LGPSKLMPMLLTNQQKQLLPKKIVPLEVTDDKKLKSFVPISFRDD